MAVFSEYRWHTFSWSSSHDPSVGNRNSIFYPDLTNVINRWCVYSVSNSLKITFVRVFCMISDFTWQLFSIMLHCVASYLERLQFFFLVLNTICGYENWVCQSSLLYCCHAHTILISNQEDKSASPSTDCHVPGITYTASVTINHLSWITASYW